MEPNLAWSCYLIYNPKLNKQERFIFHNYFFFKPVIFCWLEQNFQSLKRFYFTFCEFEQLVFWHLGVSKRKVIDGSSFFFIGGNRQKEHLNTKHGHDRHEQPLVPISNISRACTVGLMLCCLINVSKLKSTRIHYYTLCLRCSIL